MARGRSTKVDSRNVKLSIEAYDRLDKYLLQLMNERGVRRITLGEAVTALLDEHSAKVG